MKRQYRQLPQKQSNRELFFLILSCFGDAGHNIANLSYKLRQIIEFPSMLAHSRASLIVDPNLMLHNQSCQLFIHTYNNKYLKK
jgi:hypothetical protein